MPASRVGVTGRRSVGPRAGLYITARPHLNAFAVDATSAEIW
jgi:hypothetical protein